VFFVQATMTLATEPVPTVTPLDPARVAGIAGLLPEQPRGLGRPIGDRAAWAEISRRALFRQAIEQAEKVVHVPLKPLPDELFIQLARNGNRPQSQEFLENRRGRLK
jgi:hypothetical protein